MKNLIVIFLFLPFIGKAQLGLTLTQLKTKYELKEVNNTFYTEDEMCTINFEIKNTVCTSYTFKSKTETSDDFILLTLKEYRVVAVQGSTIYFVHNKNSNISCTLITGEKFKVTYYFNNNLK